MASTPFIATSRGGVLVALILLGGCSAVLMLQVGQNGWKPRLGIGFGCFFVIAFGCYLGWKQLLGRTAFDSTLSGRTQVYANARKIIDDFPIFGTGPGTFSTVYELYRGQSVDDVWAAYLHDDWMQTRLEWGLVGVIPVALTGLMILGVPWVRKTGVVSPVFSAMVTISLIGCLLHAKFDFPFQVYSILMLATVLSAVLFSYSGRSLTSAAVRASFVR